MTETIDLSGRHVVIAAGDFARASLIGVMVHDMGAPSVTLVADTACAITHVRSGKCDVVICEANLEPGGGFEVAAASKAGAEHWHGHAPVILLTPEPTRQFVLEAKNVGARSVLGQPLSPLNLSRAVARCIGVPLPGQSSAAQWKRGPAWSRRIWAMPETQRA